MIRCLLVLALAASVGAAQTELANRFLARHNQERARVGVPPLVWDNQLAMNAAGWARQLAATGRFEHGGAQAEGENLWSGSRGGFAPEAMVDAWIGERADYKPGRFPDVSRSGNWANVGHYTQLIWSRTTRLGCAVASNNQNDILVCRYFPRGNMRGEDPLSRQPAAAPPPQGASLPARLLERHNQMRARAGVPLLAWHQGLAQNAAAWAQQLARSGRLQHAGLTDQGENLWMGTAGRFAPEAMVDSWIQEGADYKPGRFPDVSRSGNWMNVGHFTQVIWWRTTHVGCAVASNNRSDVLVCRYGPPGNMQGEFVVPPRQ